MDHPTVPPSTEPFLTYPRARRIRPGLFAGRFVTLFSIGLVLGGLFAFVDAAWAVGAIGAYMMDEIPSFPVDIVAAQAFRLLLDGLLLCGCLSALWRWRGSRPMLRSFAILQFTELGVSAVLLLLMASNSYLPRSGARLSCFGLLIILGRSGFAWLLLAATRSMTADFYFGEHVSPAVPLSSPQITRLEQRPVTFVVRGRDIASGAMTQFESKATSEELARVAAVAMGMEGGSIRVDPVEPEDGQTR